MNKFYIFAVAICLVFKGYTQTPNWTDIFQVNTSGPSEVNVVTNDKNNVYTATTFWKELVVNGNSVTTTTEGGVVVSKVSVAGVINWNTQFSLQEGSINADAIAVDSLGFVYVSVIFNGSVNCDGTVFTSSENINALLIKMNQNGEVQWSVTYLSNGSGRSRINIDENSNVYLISKSSRLLKYNSAGELVSEKEFLDGTLRSICIDGSVIYIAGKVVSVNTSFGSINFSTLGSGFIVKSDLNDNYNGSYELANTDSFIGDVVADGDHNLIITGYFNGHLDIGSSSFDGKSTFIAKCDADFNFSWEKVSTNLSNAPLNFRLYVCNDTIYQYAPVQNNHFEFGTIQVNTSHTSGECYVLKLDSNGDAVSAKVIFNTDLDLIKPISNYKVLIARSKNEYGDTFYGYYYLTLHNPDYSKNWQVEYKCPDAGSCKFSSAKYDANGNTILLFRIQGKVIFGGETLQADVASTVLAKIDVEGNVLWRKIIPDEEIAYFGPILNADRDENIIIVGRFKNEINIEGTTLTTTNADYEAYVAKFSATGNLLWAKPFELGFDVDSYISFTTDSHRNVLITGVNMPDNYIIKFDKDGNKVWSNSFAMGSYYTSVISTDSTDNIYMATEVHLDCEGIETISIGSIQFTQQVGDGSTVIVKFDTDGNAIWAKSYGRVEGASYTSGWPSNIKNDSEGNSYIWAMMMKNAQVGTTTLVNDYGYTYLNSLFKLDSEGNVLWVNAYPDKYLSFNYGDLLDLDNKGNVYVASHYTDSIKLNGDELYPIDVVGFFIAKYSTSNGDPGWYKILTMGDKSNSINAISVLDNDIVSVTGTADSRSSIDGLSVEHSSGDNCMIATLRQVKQLEVSSQSLTIASDNNSSISFNIISNIDWTITVGDSWLSASTLSGTGNASITLTAVENGSTTERNTTVTVSGSGVESKSIVVTQAGATPYLNVSEASLAIGSAGGSEKNFSISSNINWTINVSETWLTASLYNGSGDADVALVASWNQNALQRSANVSVIGDNVDGKTIVVTQDANPSGIIETGNDDFQLFPNPVTDILYISKNIEVKGVKATIYDVYGNIVLETFLDANFIDVNSLQDGLYVIKLENGKIYSSRFVKK